MRFEEGEMTQAEAMRFEEGEMAQAGAHSSIQIAGSRMQPSNIQDTASRIQGEPGYRIQARMQDIGYKVRLSAWWPLSRGAGGFIESK